MVFSSRDLQLNMLSTVFIVATFIQTYQFLLEPCDQSCWGHFSSKNIVQNACFIQSVHEKWCVYLYDREFLAAIMQPCTCTCTSPNSINKYHPIDLYPFNLFAILSCSTTSSIDNLNKILDNKCTNSWVIWLNYIFFIFYFLFTLVVHITCRAGSLTAN